MHINLGMMSHTILEAENLSKRRRAWKHWTEKKNKKQIKEEKLQSPTKEEAQLLLSCAYQMKTRCKNQQQNDRPWCSQEIFQILKDVEHSSHQGYNENCRLGNKETNRDMGIASFSMKLHYSKHQKWTGHCGQHSAICGQKFCAPLTVLTDTSANSVQTLDKNPENKASDRTLEFFSKLIDKNFVLSPEKTSSIKILSNIQLMSWIGTNIYRLQVLSVKVENDEPVFKTPRAVPYWKRRPRQPRHNCNYNRASKS